MSIDTYRLIEKKIYSNDTFINDYRDIPEDVLNTYCWIHSTYTVVDAFMKKQGSEVPFPGVHNSQGRGPLTIKHTKYYQWVAFTLFFQVSATDQGTKYFFHPSGESWKAEKLSPVALELTESTEKLPLGGKLYELSPNQKAKALGKVFFGFYSSGKVYRKALTF